MDGVVEHFFFFSTQMGTEDIQVLQKWIASSWLSRVNFSIPVPPSHSHWHPGVHTPGLELWNAEKNFPS